MITSTITLESRSTISETSIEKLPAAIQSQAQLSSTVTSCSPFSCRKAQSASPKAAAMAEQATIPATRVGPSPPAISWPRARARRVAKCKAPQSALPRSGARSKNQRYEAFSMGDQPFSSVAASSATVCFRR